MAIRTGGRDVRPVVSGARSRKLTRDGSPPDGQGEVTRAGFSGSPRHLSLLPNRAPRAIATRARRRPFPVPTGSHARAFSGRCSSRIARYGVALAVVARRPPTAARSGARGIPIATPERPRTQAESNDSRRRLPNRSCAPSSAREGPLRRGRDVPKAPRVWKRPERPRDAASAPVTRPAIARYPDSPWRTVESSS